ncbi:DUF2235 domain-containing protein [Variovorax ginsengisoli]|uniref:DUF2235 domain-containing protein n=1 Tax=Variovorax ginsengisoli TaxID=363844 RepID=A0ABT8S2Q5_9BURK|nr:DUF2235 domain-containing protein [Variovorax ginsengisoli]MDN8614048.1 DUF2235 domain-containing protein [Variovorax ginsengisoli]MDO1533218.1 DUF2235 domain-containing protein [Variovorax ginsengisoli]
MAKNIVFCADGTWKGLGHDQGDGDELQADATNVLRLFAALAGEVTPDSLRKQDEQEKVALGPDGGATQVAKYLHGVGDSGNAIRKILGGVFGEGFIERIVRGYTFLSRNYQPGDRIYLAGFSRGAYTVRALGGMIAAMGLLPPDAMRGDDGRYDAGKAYGLGIHVWAEYRRRAGKASTLLGYLEEFKSRRIDLARLVQGAGIEAIGVWDTVGSLGVPLYDPADAKKIDVFEFADRALSPKVRSGFHAIAIDEQRGDFEPTLWDARDGVHQRWFCGAHADVGGGYPTQDLSGFALDWMIGHFRDGGVAISPQYQAVKAGNFGPVHTPYKDPPFALLPHGPRKIPQDALFHPSVQVYLDGFAGYQPQGLAALLRGRRLDPGLLRA